MPKLPCRIYYNLKLRIRLCTFNTMDGYCSTHMYMVLFFNKLKVSFEKNKFGLWFLKRLMAHVHVALIIDFAKIYKCILHYFLVYLVDCFCFNWLPRLLSKSCVVHCNTKMGALKEKFYTCTKQKIIWSEIILRNCKLQKLSKIRY